MAVGEENASVPQKIVSFSEDFGIGSSVYDTWVAPSLPSLNEAILYGNVRHLWLAEINGAARLVEKGIQIISAFRLHTAPTSEVTAY